MNAGKYWRHHRRNQTGLFRPSVGCHNAPSNNRAKLDIDVASIDTSHAERNKHLHGERFIDALPPKAAFVSTMTLYLSDYEIKEGIILGPLAEDIQL